MKVVIVEDDGIISLYLKECVEALGHEVTAVMRHSHDVETFTGFDETDLVMMDINIYGPKDGIVLARSIFEKHGVRSVFITSYKDSEALNSAMAANPLWYITKPLKEQDIETVLLMAQNLQQRLGPEPDNVLKIGPYDYDKQKALFFENGIPLKLGSIEVGILLTLARQVNSVVSAETLIAENWPTDPDNTKKLRDSIYRIRKKMPELTIISYSKIGYLLKIK
jgi:DNA-binding response OmpR family regulator